MALKSAWLLGAALTLTATAAVAAPRAATLADDLRPGLYVHARGECRDAPKAAFRTFDGDNLSGPVGGSCRSQVIWSRSGEQRLRQHCDEGARSQTKATQTRLRVTSPDSFELIDVHSHPAAKAPTVRKATRFRRCAALNAAGLR